MGYETGYITGYGLEDDIEPPRFGNSELDVSDSPPEGASEQEVIAEPT